MSGLVRIDFHAEAVAEHAAPIQGVHGELLRQTVGLVAHDHAETIAAHLGIRGNGAGSGKRLRQFAHHESNSVAGECDVAGRARNLWHELGAVNEEVFQFAFRSAAGEHTSHLRTGLRRGTEVVPVGKAWQLAKLAVGGSAYHEELRLSLGDLLREQVGFGEVDTGLVHRRLVTPTAAFTVKLPYSASRSVSIFSTMAITAVSM